MTDKPDYQHYGGWVRFFNNVGYMTLQTAMLETSVSVEEHYQHIKARLQAELGLNNDN